MSKLKNTKFLVGDAKEKLKELPDESVQTVITSPPYWSLRDYKAKGQIGREETPQEYVRNLADIFDEVWRVLHPTGTVWLNIGDSYIGSSTVSSGKTSSIDSEKYHDETNNRPNKKATGSLKKKDLVGVPWRVAFELQDRGWWLRQDIIWSKTTPMPESVTDRCTNIHEYIFLLSKSKKYYYDYHSIKEPLSQQTKDGNDVDVGFKSVGRNKWSVWDVKTASFGDAHFAAYPVELIEPCVAAGTSERGGCSNCGSPYERVIEKGDPVYQDAGNRKVADAPGAELSDKSYFRHGKIYGRDMKGWKSTCNCNAGEPVSQTVLDPFMGRGTTGAASLKNGRKFIGIDINEEYIEMAEDWIKNHEDVPKNHKFW